MLAADGGGEVDLDDAADDGLLAGPTAWLFGNEAWGLPAERRRADHRVRSRSTAAPRASTSRPPPLSASTPPPAPSAAPARPGMTIIIDPPNAAGHGRLWSHLASDTSYDELHEFALGIGCRTCFDRDHYDVPSEWYDRVVATAPPR